MIFTHWNDELEIYDKEAVLGDDEWSIIHLWQTEKDNVVFVIKEGYQLKEEIFESKKIFTIEKVKP